MSKDNKKKKKVKTKYYDDGSTIVDMSAIDSYRPRAFGSRPASEIKYDKNGKPESRFRASVRTYFQTVKLMLGPMFITIGIISAAFLIVWILLSLAS